MKASSFVAFRAARRRGGWWSLAALAALAAAVPGPARADDPNVLERIASVKRSPEGTSARLLDTPVLQVVRAEEERFAGGQREEVRIASSPLFSVFRNESTTTASGAVSRTRGEGRFASLLGVSLLEWSTEKEHGLSGAGRTSAREWRFLDFPVLGSVFARKTSDAGSSYEVLFITFGDDEPEVAEGPPEGDARPTE
jgi:hypothetical protein